MNPFSPEIIASFVFLGTLAGFLAGLLGIGGGIILVPLFLWTFHIAGFPPQVVAHAAFGTSLAIIIPTTLSSTLAHRKRGNVNWHHVFRLAVGGILGSVSGASIASLLPGDWLKGLFGFMQIAVALKLFISHPYLPPERSDKIPFLSLFYVGFAGGLFSSFFGVGGGIIAVPLMVTILQLPVHLAVGNSSALIVISSFFGMLSYIFHGWEIPELPPFSLGYVNILVALIVAPFTILSARLGVRVAGKVSHDKLVKIFAVLLAFVGLRMITAILLR